MKNISKLVAIATLLIFNACSDDPADTPNQGLSNEETIGFVEKSAGYEEAIDLNLDRFIADVVANGRTPFPQLRDLEDCTEVQSTQNENVYTFTFTFEEGGCDDQFGNIHTGVVQAVVTLGADEVVIDKTFSNYTFNGNSVQGDIHSVITTNDDDQKEISRTANLIFTNTEGLSNDRTAHHTITMIAGEGDTDWTNDVYSITGGSTNELSTGTTWVVTNVSAVVRPGSCDFYAVSGQKSVVNSNNNAQSFFIDFGDGECDGIANITLPNGQTIQYNQF